MTNLTNWEKELENITGLFELDKEDGTPLYEDGDVRIGFKKKELHNFICQLLQQQRAEIVEMLRRNNMFISHAEFCEIKGNQFRQCAKCVLEKIINQIKAIEDEKQN